MRATVLLPLPLSPTSAVTTPGRSVNDTSSTACSCARRSESAPPIGNVLPSPRTSSSFMRSSTRWQATRWPGSTSRSVGRSLV